MMRVLVTRAADDIPRELADLDARGHHGIACPLLAISMLPVAGPVVGDAQAVLVTSRAGARALAAADPERAVPVLAVGDATAAAARTAGFARVESAGGDWIALAALARRCLVPGGGRLVHAVGAAEAGDLTGVLAADGFDALRVVLYQATMATELPAAGRVALQSGAVDAVQFFSPRTAAAFATLAGNQGLISTCAPLDALCLSANVADAVRALPWRRLRIAATPDRDALYDLMESDD